LRISEVNCALGGHTRASGILLGVEDSPASLAFASQKARAIELDILSGNYDITLLKYRPQILGKTATVIQVSELFKRFTDYQFKVPLKAHGKMPPMVLVAAT
jgi:integrase